ncbi:acyl-ACP--UDP-N-acetylglucosamine O-acyltransferase [Magnetococcales bacterium HHB-1]
MIHPTAVIDRSVQLGENVSIGPYVVIGSDVTIKDDVKIHPHVVISGPTVIDEGCQIFSFASIGQDPQHLQYDGEKTRVTIGKQTQIREYVSIHKGTEQGGGITSVGDHCFLMAYTHIAHDCHVGNHVIMANAATLAGHVEIGDHAVIGGLTAIHQFARVGSYCFIGGASAVSMDIIPFASAVGNRSSITGINTVGLRRNKVPKETIQMIRQAHRILFRSGLKKEEALSKIEENFPESKEVQMIIDFVRQSQRGICR